MLMTLSLHPRYSSRSTGIQRHHDLICFVLITPRGSKQYSLLEQVFGDEILQWFSHRESIGEEALSMRNNT
jgi:hypothetical protein